MTVLSIYSLLDAPECPRFSALYSELGYTEHQFNSQRKIISALNKSKPDVITAQFLYAYSNNYASNHFSNLDTLLITLQKESGQKPAFIFFVYKDEAKYLEEMIRHYDGFSRKISIIPMPVGEQKIRDVLADVKKAKVS